MRAASALSHDMHGTEAAIDLQIFIKLTDLACVVKVVQCSADGWLHHMLSLCSKLTVWWNKGSS